MDTSTKEQPENTLISL